MIGAGRTRQYAPPPTGRERRPSRAAATGNSQSSAPDSSRRRYGVCGTGAIRRGIRGESYWLESYSIPSSASTSYAQGVSRVIENAGAR